MWKQITIFTWVSLVFVAGWYVWQVTTSKAEAYVYLYPTANGSIQEWRVQPAGGSHYMAVDDNVIEPTIPDNSDYLYVGSSGSGTEREDLVFHISSAIGGITGAAVWVYGTNLGCVGGGADNCDTVTLTLPEYNKTIGTFTAPEKIGWKGKAITFAEPVYLPLGFDNDVTLRLQRTAVGGGANKDTIAFSAIYIQFTTTSDQKDPAIPEKEIIDDPPQSTATEKTGEKDTDPPGEKGGGDDSPQSSAILRGGGADVE